MRTTLGFLVAPIAIPIGLLLMSESDVDCFTEGVVEAVFFIVVWYSYPLFFTLIFALPLYLFLNRFDLVRCWTSLGAGLIIGGIGTMSINGQPQLFYVKLVVLSGISGLVFWLIAKYQPRLEDSSESTP